MKCPRCGQETVNISNRHICTACGIVISESVPRDQILEQLRSKVASQNARNQAMHSTPSVSNTAQGNTSNVGTATIERAPALHEAVAGKTLDQISREMLLKNNLPKQRTETSQVHNAPVEVDSELIPDTEGEKVIPRVDSVEVIPESQQVEQKAQNQSRQVAEVSQSPEPANVLAPAYANSAPSNTQAIYPSHQVNPILIKILISVVLVLILSIIGYIIYANFNKTGGMVDNMIKYLGENVFK